jgi:hypothetical protein
MRLSLIKVCVKQIVVKLNLCQQKPIAPPVVDLEIARNRVSPSPKLAAKTRRWVTFWYAFHGSVVEPSNGQYLKEKVVLSNVFVCSKLVA